MTSKPGLGTAVALLGGGAVLTVLLARRATPRNAHLRPVLGSFSAELALRLFADAAPSSLRNGVPSGRLKYRALGAYGEDYPSWVRALRGKSGVYVIRDRATHQPLYVGVSASDRLYETLTRHLQFWKRSKQWHIGVYVESENDPGVVYNRASVEVAARVLSSPDAVDEEVRLIRALKPRDNINLVTPPEPEPVVEVLEDAPF